MNTSKNAVEAAAIAALVANLPPEQREIAAAQIIGFIRGVELAHSIEEEKSA